MMEAEAELQTVQFWAVFYGYTVMFRGIVTGIRQLDSESLDLTSYWYISSITILLPLEYIHARFRICFCAEFDDV